MGQRAMGPLQSLCLGAEEDTLSSSAASGDQILHSGIGPLTQSPTTLFSLNRQEMDLMGGPFSG